MKDVKMQKEECPYVGAYPKCNNADGCANCKEFDNWLKEKELELNLQNCPCCGGPAHFFERNFGLKCTQKVSARCDDCRLQTPWVTNRTTAARLWNRRVK